MKGSRTERPEGFLYVPDFFTEAEEHELLSHVREVAFSGIRMHGQVARRRTAHFAPGATIGWHRDAPMFGPKRGGT